MLHSALAKGWELANIKIEGTQDFIDEVMRIREEYYQTGKLTIPEKTPKTRKDKTLF